METLPSLHLFSKGTLQGGPYNDLDYLKVNSEIQPGLTDIHFGAQVFLKAKTGSNRHKAFPHLHAFYDYLAKLEPGKQSRVILFNSPAGKNESLNQVTELAKILCQSGKRVLMLDCNLRTAQSFFDSPSGIGVGDYVTGNAGFDRIINESGHKNVFFIKSGHSVGNSVKLLMSARFIELIDRVKNEFDYVLVNSSPYRKCIDAFVVAKFLRPIVLLLRNQKQNQQDDVSDVRDELSVLKLPVMELAEA